MIISDLNHLENVTETSNLVGGEGEFSILISEAQYSNLYQVGYSSAKAAAQFGGAKAVSTVVNSAEVVQGI